MWRYCYCYTVTVRVFIVLLVGIPMSVAWPVFGVFIPCGLSSSTFDCW
jgi:hypothetical protein